VIASSAKVGITISQSVIIDNTSGINRGDNATNSQYSDQAALITSLQALVNALINEYVAPLPSVTIDGQVWQSANLDVATYIDGMVIPEVTDATQWNNLKTRALVLL
jgi:hypothetical protein